MIQYSENKRLNLFKSLFKGREDVFARRWEKGNKSGYMPAYYYDRYMYRLHKMKGGTFKNYKDKALLPLTDEQFQKHLHGEQFIGIYPLLPDNTSWFIAADFDKENWMEECRTLINVCKEKEIPAYLERSRSGKGGHVWVFFDKPYPAIRSRKILITLLEKVKIFSAFEKNSSFDRLFPNQDFHSGKGLGNLIALPLHKPTLEEGNSCFVDEQLEPYQNQWEFLSSIKKVSTSHLDAIYNALQPANVMVAPNIDSDRLHIRQSNIIRLNRAGITPQEGQNGKPFYDSDEQLLNDLLKNNKVKHHRQLRYLASRHEGATLKLRFVQNPFSFVFLLSGPEQYHIVLETLDTEEATYIWHVNKDKQSLWQKLQSIDQDLNVIRNKGRQTFLEKQPDNFSRLIHDYTDERKGFVVWKDKLEERLL